MIECLSGGMIAQEILAWQLIYHVRTKQAGTVLKQQRVCSEFGGFRGGFGCKDNATVPQDPSFAHTPPHNYVAVLDISI